MCAFVKKLQDYLQQFLHNNFTCKVFIRTPMKQLKQTAGAISWNKAKLSSKPVILNSEIHLSFVNYVNNAKL